MKDKQQAGLVDTTIVGATLPPWLLRHRETVNLPIIEKFVGGVRAIPGTGRVGAIGLCFGGRYEILVAHGKVDAAFACHPSLRAIPSDLDPVKKPVSLAVGSEDSLLSVD